MKISFVKTFAVAKVRIARIISVFFVLSRSGAAVKCHGPRDRQFDWLPSYDSQSVPGARMGDCRFPPDRGSPNMEVNI